VEDDVRAGREAASILLARPHPPTALVCASDSLALGAHDVDPSVAVIGFDDTPVARAVGLTSVAQPVVPAAAACFEQVLEVITGTARAPQQLLLRPTLTVRSSTPAPAPSGN
jgi:DNA-binding LacI/PurR family transcriptional regulator